MNCDDCNDCSNSKINSMMIKDYFINGIRVCVCIPDMADAFFPKKHKISALAELSKNDINPL